MKDAAVHRLAKSITQLTLCQVTTSEVDDATKLLEKACQNAVWNRRYMEPKPGYTLEQLWADSEPAISKKTSTSYEVQTNDVLRAFFLWSAPVAFRRVALETPEWTSRDSNHHRQSVSAGKTNAIVKNHPVYS